ncbi:flagellar operon protein TIGR03826 [Caminicella sporogenes DSM 14501]|uniref:Flagellar operon protein TIGR03826 n=1 Tax=Caminicella sporogenes DSM 14501 TaxID=1121266 RepID=A0A1M6Q117_9FIRM|nr:TIGR03826 family flagellar region protein [Caminicella sporogenes]RKD23538.1 MerR family transcriptional regulator [Caminicella sporogenes]SHK13945.1 flagellar operon protein TIGR03826 [Caminicella sporogenes DSM 14501]
MDIRNCKECGKLFQYDGISKLCYSCRKKDEEDFKRVKDYIYDNTGATITEVSEATGVSEDKILRYLREGRLEIVGENPGLVLDCERCGRAIRTGRYCEECAREIEKELRSGFERPVKRVKTEKDRDRMHIASFKKRT